MININRNNSQKSWKPILRTFIVLALCDEEGREGGGKSKHSELVSARQIAAKVCRQLEFLPERDEWAQESGMKLYN